MMPDSEPATPFIPPRPDIGTPGGHSPAVLPSVVPMSPSQVGIALQKCLQNTVSSPPSDYTASSPRRCHHPGTRFTPPTLAHPSSRLPWLPQDLITCRPSN